MRVMRINIEQQRAQIDIDIQNARLQLKMPDRRMEIRHIQPEMAVASEAPEVRLDMDELKANTGLKNNDQLLAEAVQKAKAEARQGVRDIVNLSDFLGDVTVQGNKVAMAAKDQMLAYQNPDMGRSPVPPGVEMDGKPGKLEIEWTDHDLSIDWTGDYMPEFYVEPPCSVNVEISRPPSVKISVEEVYIPASSGRNVNTEV
jgi:hypothetical protein